MSPLTGIHILHHNDTTHLPSRIPRWPRSLLRGQPRALARGPRMRMRFCLLNRQHEGPSAPGGSARHRHESHDHITQAPPSVCRRLWCGVAVVVVAVGVAVAVAVTVALAVAVTVAVTVVVSVVVTVVVCQWLCQWCAIRHIHRDMHA